MKCFSSIFITLLLSLTPYTAAQQTDPGRISFGNLSWSPDGNQLLFTTMLTRSDWSDYSPDKWTLFLYDIQSDELRVLGNSIMRATFNPQANKIIYSKLVKDNWEIFVRKLKNGKEKNISNHPDRDASPFWGPNGLIAFNSDRSGTTEIYTMKASGKQVKQRSNSGEHKSYNPEISPDGTTICYYLEKGDGKDQIYLLDMKTDAVQNISRDEAHSYFPGWIDEQTLVFSRGDRSLWRMDRDGSNKRLVPGAKGAIARYQPRSRALGIANPEEGQIELLYPGGERQILLGQDRLRYALHASQ